MMTTKRVGNHLFVYHNGELVYKRWYKRGANGKTQPSLLWNVNGCPHVQISP